MADITEHYQLKWHSFGSHLHSCVASALNNETFADVVLFTMDGHQISAHRFVLSACSQYLHQILKYQARITTTLPLLIVLPPEISYKTLKTLIQYMYSGETTVSKDILEHVLRGGDLLRVKGLWRPKEERYNEKKLVKLQEQREHVSQQTQQPQQQRQQRQQPQQTQQPNSTQTNKQQKVLSEANNKHENHSAAQNCDHKATQKSPKVDVTQSSKNSNEENEEKNDDKMEKLQDSANDSEGSSVEETPKKPSAIEAESTSLDNLQFLVIKEEPIEWSELDEESMEMVEETDMFHSEMTIKPEVVLDDQEEKSEEMYSPLTCELCAETFTLPADWVRHIQTHTDMLPAKRQRRGKSNDEQDDGSFPPLHCDMCQKYFPSPAEWVRHIQNAHTEFELRVSNKTSPVRPVRVSRNLGSSHKVCTICSKKFPSHASMLIHKRTHTGEKPYMCEHCHKGFNVKSNLLRHLRTLHDRIINSTEVEYKENSDNT